MSSRGPLADTCNSIIRRALSPLPVLAFAVATLSSVFRLRIFESSRLRICIGVSPGAYFHAPIGRARSCSFLSLQSSCLWRRFASARFHAPIARARLCKSSRLQSSVFRLPSSVFRLPSSVFASSVALFQRLKFRPCLGGRVLHPVFRSSDLQVFKSSRIKYSDP